MGVEAPDLVGPRHKSWIRAGEQLEDGILVVGFAGLAIAEGQP